MPIRASAARLQAFSRPVHRAIRSVLAAPPPGARLRHLPAVAGRTSTAKITLPSTTLRTMSTNPSTTTATAAAPAGPGNAPSAAAAPGRTGAAPATAAVAEEEPPASPGPVPPAASGSSDSPGSSEKPKPLPTLPAPTPADRASADGCDNGLRTVEVNGQAVALDNLGPMVVGRDGTVSRIANWHEMTELERETTLRVLGKRNQLRLGNLRAGRPADAKPAAASGSEGGSGDGAGLS